MKKVISLVAVVGLCAGGYYLYWQGGVKAHEASIEKYMDERSMGMMDTNHSGMSTSGFPFSYNTTMKNVSQKITLADKLKTENLELQKAMDIKIGDMSFKSGVFNKDELHFTNLSLGQMDGVSYKDVDIKAFRSDIYKSEGSIGEMIFKMPGENDKSMTYKGIAFASHWDREKNSSFHMEATIDELSVSVTKEINGEKTLKDFSIAMNITQYAILEKVLKQAISDALKGMDELVANTMKMGMEALKDWSSKGGKISIAHLSGDFDGYKAKISGHLSAQYDQQTSMPMPKGHFKIQLDKKLITMAKAMSPMMAMAGGEQGAKAAEIVQKLQEGQDVDVNIDGMSITINGQKIL